MIPDSVTNYLKKYAPGKWKIEQAISSPVNTVIVIPAINEYNNIRKLLLSLSANDPKYFNETAALFVINNCDNASSEIKEDNSKSIRLLKSIIYKEDGNDELARTVIASGLEISIVDASSEELKIPEKDAGVGFARKIGMDLALSLFDYSSDRKKITIALDADCTVENNYITEIINNYNDRGLKAAVINFEHNIFEENETTEAIICYEIFLRYYVLGLKWAGSYYGFHSMGSCMSCDYSSYIKIEGMNKRKAAEDFYFLEKLSKNVKIESISTTTVHPSSRSSWRVPFGTGQRVNRFLSKARNEYVLHDPESFVILKKWLNLFCSNEVLTPNSYLEKAGAIHHLLPDFLKEQKFVEDWKKIIANSKSEEQIKKQKLVWFDGFKTMKLIHYLRDAAFPDINMFDALDKYFYITMKHNVETLNLITRRSSEGERAVPSLQLQREYLIYLRYLDKTELHNDY